MKDYVINKNTLALVPLNRRKTIAYEDHDCYIVDQKVSTIMENNCIYYGSTFDKIQKRTISLTGYNYKSPIILEEEKELILFPTTSPRQRDCTWINLNNIDKIENIDPDNEKCQIDFLNNESLVIDSSYRVINNQYIKSILLQNANKKEKIKNKN